MISNSITIMMTREEAQEHVVAIKNSAADMGRRLLDLKEREGWRVLGYETWTACLQNEFAYSRNHLYELMKATPILESLSSTDYKLSMKAAVALADYDEALHPAIVKTAKSRYGELTESNIKRVGEVVQTMTTTGHVDTGNGSMTPIDAALEIEDYEALQRHREYKSRSLAPLMTSETPEWYTPDHIISKVRMVLGDITLDPCSNSNTNPNVPALNHYTVEDNGLSQEWFGGVYMNPPYGDEIKEWVAKLVEAYELGNVDEAIALLPARTDTAWMRMLSDYPRCFVWGRLKFSGSENSAPFPSVVVYLGKDTAQFATVFQEIGDIYVKWSA
jgi:hypothetical protein